MIIRPFEPRDIGPVTSLVRGVMAAEGRGADFGGLGIDIEEIGVGERSGNWVAEEEGEIVGVLSIQPTGSDVCAIKRLVVAPSHYHEGVHEALFDHGRQWAVEAGYRDLLSS